MLDLEGYFALCGLCRRLGLRCLSVVNGTRITDPGVALRMVEEGPDEVTVSLDSHVETLHDRVRGVGGSFRAAVQALRLLVDARLKSGQSRKIYAMMLVFDENHLDLGAMYDFVLRDIGADKMKINLLQPTFGWFPGPVDEFFVRHSRMDGGRLVALLGECDIRHGLGLNPAWLSQVGMYVRSVRRLPKSRLQWGRSMTTEVICNSYDRNIMVDLSGMARFCFSTAFLGMQLRVPGDLRFFWESAGTIRRKMIGCRALCGISHSVRRESCTLAGKLRFGGGEAGHGVT